MSLPVLSGFGSCQPVRQWPLWDRTASAAVALRLLCRVGADGHSWPCTDFRLRRFITSGASGTKLSGAEKA